MGPLARKKSSTTRLPQSLLDELGLGEPSSAAGSGRGSYNGKGLRKGKSRKGSMSRKEERKQTRDMKKARKKDYFMGGQVAGSSTTQSDGQDHQQIGMRARTTKRPADEHPDSPQCKKLKRDSGANGKVETSKEPRQQQAPSSLTKKNPESNRTTKINISKLRSKSKTQGGDGIVRPLKSQVERDEDAYIAYLEARLENDSQRKGKKKSAGDGLDDLLDFTSGLTFKEPEHGSSADDDMAPSDESVSGDEEEEDGQVYSGEEWSESDNEDEGVNDKEDEDEEWGGIEEPAMPHEVKSKLNTEDVKPPVSAGAYVPPHLRKQAPVPASEEDIKLKRQLKGLINRMSEQNIASILESAEEVYRNHRRHDVTSTLTELIIDGVASHSSLLDSFVVLHGAFIASLHKLIGVEFAAYFVQTVVTLYEKHYSELQAPVDPNAPGDGETRGKECSNLMVLLSELYNFQVISATLIYDLIRGLLNGDLTEFNVELLLKITRNSGYQLRQDDPSALKDIVQIVQSKVTDSNSTLSSRTKFMIETLSNLKNNKSKRNIAQNQGGEAVERMKKFLSGIGKKRHVLAHEPLRVTLEDLHAAESKGKWWLVGAAWSGDPLVDKAAERAATVSQDPLAENALLALARKQGMNTDIRRSIFVVLMSSEDYVDACERLSQLKLTEVQQREIVRVLLHCCGNEKAYNPYYTLVCQHLCRLSHSYKITVQFCLWDFLRDLGESNVGGAEVIKNVKDDSIAFDGPTMSKSRWGNVARAYGWWIAKDGVSLNILKPLDFSSLKATTRGFMHELLSEVFINSQLNTPMLVTTSMDFSKLSTDRRPLEEIFSRAMKLESLAMGLVYFITESFRKVEGKEDFVKFVKWAQTVAQDTLRTGLV